MQNSKLGKGWFFLTYCSTDGTLPKSSSLLHENVCVCSFSPIANNSTPAFRRLSAGGMTSSWDFPSVMRIPILGIPTREPDSGLKQFSKIKVNARPGDTLRDKKGGGKKRRRKERERGGLKDNEREKTKRGKLSRQKSKCERAGTGREWGSSIQW